LIHFLLSVSAMMTQAPAPSDDLLTVAEASQYQATSTSAQVRELIDRIAARSGILSVTELGKTFKGEPIPLMVLANPPVSTAREAKQTGKPICLVMANIHAGEVEGKEACLMIARELALDPHHGLLKDIILVIAPNYNADGNDEFDEVMKNRPGQDGPARCGVRPNAQGLDLNRDYIKLEAPESQALARFLTEWDPHLTIDCHTTNGSYHRYTLTYEAPLNPSGHPAPINFVRNKLLPEVTKRVKAQTGYDMWHYGNFNREHTVWETYSSQPRFGGAYQGLRSQMSVLSEAYTYASYNDRVRCTHALILQTLGFVAENKTEVIEINRQAREEVTKRGLDSQPDDIVGIRHLLAAFNEPAIVKGYANTPGLGGERGAVITGEHDLGPPKDYSVVHRGRFEPILSVRRPFAYLIPNPDGHAEPIIEKLRQHGITVEATSGEAIVEAYTLTKIDRDENAFQGHRTVTVEVTSRVERRTLPKECFKVRTGQPLGTLAVYLLEPQSDDGLLTWNFFDGQLEVGQEFPVLRVFTETDLNP